MVVAVTAVAVTSVECHAAEALLEVDMPQGDMHGVDTPVVATVGLEWALMVHVGVALT